MGNDNVFGVEPPKDADGKAIPLDTEILYTTNGQIFHANHFRYMTKEKRWVVSGYFEQGRKFAGLTTPYFMLTPPDSWEKLEEDAYKTACEYALASRMRTALQRATGADSKIANHAAVR